MADHALYLGHDAEMEYLVRVYDDGTAELATRPVNSRARWSVPVTLKPEPAEVCS